MADDTRRPTNMGRFLVIWLGQLLSTVGSGLTYFALGVWLYERTEEATPLALTAAFATLPDVLLMPIAGVVADRYDRRKVMILADSGAALVTVVAAGLLFFGDLQVWQVYLVSLLGSTFSAFQHPAYTASTTMLVPKKDLARAGGLLQIGTAIQFILTPVAAGTLYGRIGLRGILLIDAVTFLTAVGALLIVRIPRPDRTSPGEEKEGERSFWADVVFGWRYLFARPGLFGLLLYFASVNFALAFTNVLWGPLVLSFRSSYELGIVQMVGGGAMLVGGLVMGAWGGPKRRLPWLVVSIILATGGLLVAGVRATVPLITAGQVILSFFVPFAAGLSQAIFLTKVPPDVQGRVFSIRGMIAHSIMPVAYAFAGPLADGVFEPLMTEGGWLGRSFVGDWLGVGPGRGVGLMFVLCWLFLWIESGLAYSHPRIRRVEVEVPDAVGEGDEQ